MEEGETVEIQETREPLREQGSIRALLELLEQQGMEQEKGDVLRMADYIDSMEMQLGTVLKELGEVKKQLGVMQESKVKLFAVNTIQKAEHQLQTLRFQVGEWKRCIYTHRKCICIEKDETHFSQGEKRVRNEYQYLRL